MIVLFALAGTRLTRAWLHESIGEKLRRPIESATAINTEMVEDGELLVLDSARTLAAKDFVTDLISCSHCIGFWFTLACAVAWRFRPLRPIVTALAASMVHSAIVEHYPNYDHADD